MRFTIVTLGDYLKGHDNGTVAGRKVIRRHNGRLIFGCAYCKKTGFDHDGISVCPICRGKKRNYIREPVVLCAFCKGTGTSGNSSVCRVCKGKALVPVEGVIERCPECTGKGRITGTDLMCIKCKGIGVVKGKDVL